MYGVAGSMLMSMPSENDSPFMLAGAVCLLAASYSGVVLLKVNNSASSRKRTVVTRLGVVGILLAPFIPFPVGCNLQLLPYNLTNVSFGCPASPIGTWSTIWPNVLLLDLGLVFASIGLASRKPDRSPVVGAGMGLITGGLLFIAFGYSSGYLTTCPPYGCLPLTSAEWWSLFWPNVLAKIIGTGQIAAGITACFVTLHRQSHLVRLSQSPR